MRVGSTLSTLSCVRHGLVCGAQRLREDEQRLGELRRVEAERGSTADAVQLIFPPGAASP